jgi:hypothetical protein
MKSTSTKTKIYYKIKPFSAARSLVPRGRRWRREPTGAGRSRRGTSAGQRRRGSPRPGPCPCLCASRRLQRRGLSQHRTRPPADVAALPPSSKPGSHFSPRTRCGRTASPWNRSHFLRILKAGGPLVLGSRRARELQSVVRRARPSGTRRDFKKIREQFLDSYSYHLLSCT